MIGVGGLCVYGFLWVCIFVIKFELFIFFNFYLNSKVGVVIWVYGMGIGLGYKQIQWGFNWVNYRLIVWGLGIVCGLDIIQVYIIQVYMWLEYMCCRRDFLFDVVVLSIWVVWVWIVEFCDCKLDDWIECEIK